MFRTMLIVITVVACASIAAAQSSDYKKFEFFGGYSHNRVDIGIGDAILHCEISSTNARAFTDSKFRLPEI